MAFPDGWKSYALKIPASQVAGDVVNFPVLFTETNLPAIMFDKDGTAPALDGGGDIRFTMDLPGANRIPSEVVTFVTDNDPANGVAELWATPSALSSSVDNWVVVWWNMPGATQPAADSTYGSENAWDSNFKMVWHGEGLDGSTDSDITGTASGATPATGKIGGGYEFNGNQDVIDLADPNNALEDTSIVYIEAWAKTDDYTAADQIILADIKSSSTFNGVAAEFNRTAYGVVGTFSTFISDGSFGWASTAHNIVDNNFHHLIYSIWDDGATVKTDYYVDAVSKGQTSIGSPSGWNFTGKTDCGLGNLANSPVAGLSYDGVLCEVRVSDVRRDQVSGYVGTNYNSQNTPANFVIFTDVTAPTITGYAPAKSSTVQPISTDIYFELNDDVSGVDKDTITVTVVAANAILNGVFQSGYSGTIASDGGIGYNVTIDPAASFMPGQVVNVTIDCDDLAGNSTVQDVYSFTCANWPYPGLTQPTIVYNGITVYLPVPVRCRLTSSAANKVNIALNKSTEIINQGYPEEMTVLLSPVFDTTFIADMITFFKNWSGQGKWFTFTSGQNSRYNGDWLLKDREWRPGIGRGGQKNYQLTFWRPYN